MAETNQNSKSFNRDGRLVALLLTPSWLSGLIAVTIGVLLIVLTLLMPYYRGNGYEQELADYRASRSQVNLADDSDYVEKGFEENTFVDYAPVLVIWSLIGVFVYILAVSIVQIVQNWARFEKELSFTNNNRREMIKTAIGHMVIRLTALLLWIIFVLFFFREILPYSAAAVLAASAIGIFSLDGILYVLLGFLVVVASVHFQTILLRLVMLKPRILSKALYLT